MFDLKAAIGRLAEGQTLGRQEAWKLFEHMAFGQASHAQLGALLMALRIRGETIDEIVGAALAMRARMVPVKAPAGAVDIVGTGGDNAGTYNISTCAAFIVAGAGVPVAKHGNRALSSKSGAADVLSALGVHLDQTPADIERCIAEAGIGFMFAPTHHPALKQLMPVRVDLATRTIFNILGPLLNPAGVRHHLVGVYSRDWVEPLAHALGDLGSERAMVVHGSDGLDEITTVGPRLSRCWRTGACAVLRSPRKWPAWHAPIRPHSKVPTANGMLPRYGACWKVNPARIAISPCSMRQAV